MNFPHNEFRVVNRNGCTLVFGAAPATQLAALMKAASEEDNRCQIDGNLARMAGANFAWGTREAIAAMKAEYAVDARAKTAAAHPEADPALVKWLATGERGSSSDAIVDHLTGLLGGGKTSHPWDPADLRRCRLLLKEVPSLAVSFHAKMPTLSPVWARLVAVWDELCATMDQECPEWAAGDGRASQTMRKMKEAIG